MTLYYHLLQAVFNGFWVVFEGIDKAPAEVHSILLPLLEGARSFATVHGEVALSLSLFLSSSLYPLSFPVFLEQMIFVRQQGCSCHSLTI